MWLILIALAIGLVYASLLYLFSKKYSRMLTIVLFALRTAVVTVLVMLFANPYIEQKINKTESPIIVIAKDNSESVSITDGKATDSLIDIMRKSHDVDVYPFGDVYTDISKALNTIERQYYKKNVGAVVLMSDGIVNQGVNPELNIESFPFPIYTVTLGDTIAHPSMNIQDVKYNKTVPANMLFPLHVSANAVNSKGKELNIVVKMDGIEVENATVPVSSNRFSKSFDFNINSGDEGMKQLEISVGEAKRRIFITVTDKKYRVLCIAKAPHPDIAAIKSSLDDHFEFNTVFEPETVNTSDYDLLVLHQVSLKSDLPTINIIGAGTDLDKFNESQNAITLSRGAVSSNLDIKGRNNSGFGLFNVENDIKNEIQSYPPLSLPHLEFAFNSRHDELLLMNIMDVETPNPLLAFCTSADGTKAAYLFGTGCWRWKLYEYYHHKNNDGFNELFSKTVKYLLTEKEKELTINHKDSYMSTENVSFTAELRNPSRELVNEPDLHITISPNSYEYVFAKGDKNYTLDIGMLPEGIYKYAAHTSLGGVEYNANGSFSVEKIGVEAQNLTADIERMRALASLTGGKHYYINDIQNIINDLDNDSRITSISRQETRYDDLINIKWLFFSIIALITIEWLLRKMFGIY